MRERGSGSFGMTSGSGGAASRAFAFSRLSWRILRRYSCSTLSPVTCAISAAPGNFASHLPHVFESARFTALQIGQRSASMNPSNVALQSEQDSASEAVSAPHSLQ